VGTGSRGGRRRVALTREEKWRERLDGRLDQRRDEKMKSKPKPQPKEEQKKLKKLKRRKKKKADQSATRIHKTANQKPFPFSLTSAVLLQVRSRTSNAKNKIQKKLVALQIANNDKRRMEDGDSVGATFADNDPSFMIHANTKRI